MMEQSLAEQLEEAIPEEDFEEKVEDTSGEQLTFVAPDDWDEERTEWFNGLDDNTRERLLGYRTERNEARDKVGEFDTLNSTVESYASALSPIEPLLRLNGMDGPAAIRQLVAAQQALDTQPIQSMEQLAKMYGAKDPVGLVRAIANAVSVNLDDLPFQEAQPEADPRFQQLADNQVHLNARMTEQDVQRQATMTAQAQTQIDSFKNEKDSEGNPSHPHFDKVSGQMGAFMSSNPSMSFEAAYGTAVRADPDLFKDNIEAEVRKRMDGNEVSRKESVKEAKAASRNVTGSRKANPRQEESQSDSVSLRSALEAAYDAQTGSP